MSAPESTFYVTGGTLRQDAACYVERQADKDLLDGLLKGEFCYVLTSRQMGKSSLMVRTAGKLREQGIHVLVLDLAAIGQNLTPEQWYDGLLVRVGRQLRLEDELEEFWDQHPKLGPCDRFFTAIREVVLQKKLMEGEPMVDEPKASGLSAINSPTIDQLVIFVDELDVVRSLPFSSDEFFAAIRECYTRRAEDPEFQRLTFCLLGVATPSDLIRDTRLTPFNIGQRIALNDFTPEEAEPLAQGLVAQPSTLNARHLLERILHWTNGHPYLTQRLCQAAAERSNRREEAPSGTSETNERVPASTAPGLVDELCGERFFSNRARELDDNLLFVRERLLRSEADLATLLHLYEQVVTGKAVPDDETNPLVSVLRLSGIVRTDGGQLVERNRIYERVFNRAWIRANMPDAEVQRQKAAYRRGVLRAMAISTAVVALLGGSLLYARYQARRADSNAHAADQQRQLAEERLYLADMNLAYEAVYAGNLGRARHLLAMHRQSQAEAGNFECRYLWQRCRGDSAFDLVGHSSTITQLHWSSNGLRLASRSLDNVLIVWDLAKKHPLFALTNAAALGGFSPEGDGVVVGHSDDSVVLYDVRTGGVRHSVPDAGRLIALVGGRSVVTVVDQNTLKFWDLATGLEKSEFRTPDAIISNPDEDTWGLKLYGDGGRLAVGSVRTNGEDNSVTIWDVPSHRPVLRLPFQGERMLFAEHGERLAVGRLKGVVSLWSASTNLEPKLIRAHDVTLRALDFSPDGRLLATGSSDQMIRLWDAETGTNLATLLGHENGIRALAFSPDGTQLASGSRDETVKIWDLHDTSAPEAVSDVAARQAPISVLFSPSSKLIAAAGIDQHLRVWQSATLSEVVSWPGTASPLCFSADEQELLTFESASGTLKWREIRRPAIQRTIELQDPPPGERTSRLAFSTQANLIAVGDTQSAVHIWHADSGAKLATLPRQIGRIKDMAFSPNGELLVWASQEGQLRSMLSFWDISKGRLLDFFLAHKSYLDHLSFSPDGRIVASASGDSSVRLWDVASRKLLGSLQGHRQPVFGVAFSHDGRLVASGSSDGTIKLWNIALQQEAATIKFDETGGKDIDDRIWRVEFAPDGSTLAGLSWGNQLKLWHAPPLADIQADERKLANPK